MDIDDFSPYRCNLEFWDMLGELVRRYRNFKVTMFTIPDECSDEWLDFINREYPFIEMAMHGADHSIYDDWRLSEEDAEAKYHFYSKPQLVKGFKAPNWKISKEACRGINTAGAWVALSERVNGNGVSAYYYDTGKQIVFANIYEDDKYFKWHGHTDTSDNALNKKFDDVIRRWSVDQPFRFISEVM